MRLCSLLLTLYTVSATFNITVGNQVLFATDILAMPDSPVMSAVGRSHSFHVAS